MLLSETFRMKVDRNLRRPYRNYRGIMRDQNMFNATDDFGYFISDLACGFGRMFVYESPKDYLGAE